MPCSRTSAITQQIITHEQDVAVGRRRSRARSRSGCTAEPIQPALPGRAGDRRVRDRADDRVRGEAERDDRRRAPRPGTATGGPCATARSGSGRRTGRPRRSGSTSICSRDRHDDRRRGSRRRCCRRRRARGTRRSGSGSFAVKFVGNTLPCWAANSVPASAPTIAPKLNAITFSLLTGIVIARRRAGRRAAPARRARFARCRAGAGRRQQHEQHDQRDVVVAERRRDLCRRSRGTGRGRTGR